MLDHSQAFADAQAGSVVPLVQVDAWYDGQQVARGLNVVSGSVAFDSTALVQASGSVVLAADDDSIVPTDFDSMLACGGAVLHMQAGIQLPGGGSELMGLGWLRISQSQTVEAWQLYRPKPRLAPALYPGESLYPSPTLTPGAGELVTGQPTAAPRGVQVTCQVEDLMAALDDDTFIAPEQPASGATVLGEIARLGAHAGLTMDDTSAWTDQAVPGSLTYGDSRSAAVVSLAAVLGATARMGRDGGLELSAAPDVTNPVWTLVLDDELGPPLATFARQYDRAGLYNAVKSTGTDQAGNQIVGYAAEQAGPLRYGGPFGCLVYQHDSPLITTQAMADADAATTLANLIAQRVVIVPLTVPAFTALETLDAMTVTLPKGDGSGVFVTVTGWVRGLTVTLGSASMSVDLAVPRSQLTAVGL